MRRVTPGHSENHERWLVSYADFVTLLFAFFVVMFATAEKDRSKAQQVSQSVREALSEGQVSAMVSALLHRQGQAPKPAAVASTTRAPQVAAPSPVLPDLAGALDQLSGTMSKEIKSGSVQVHLEPRGLIVSLKEAAFFASGDDRLNPGSIDSLEKVSAVIRGLPNPVRLEGHTDPVPIHNSRFHNNWELSAARSISMLRMFTEHWGLPTERFAVAGYADNLPIADNDTQEGRSRNRRVDVVILSTAGMRDEPAGKPGGGSYAR